MQCQVCGNHYDNAFTVTLADESFVFDCFECAIHALAPTCAHCGCKIIGHGVEHEDEIFCCEHCARQMGVDEDSAYASADDEEEDGDEAMEFDDDDAGVAERNRPGQGGHTGHRRG